MHRQAFLAIILACHVGPTVGLYAPSALPAGGSTCAVANSLLPRDMIARGMMLTIDDWDAPRAEREGSGWVRSRRGPDKAPEIHFTISLQGREVCTAQVVGSMGFPSPYAAILEAEYYPNGRTHERTLVLSNIKTAEPFRRMGFATALMDAMDVYLQDSYSPGDVEVIYLLDQSRIPRFYETQGWRISFPLKWYVVTKPLHPETGPGAALLSARSVQRKAMTQVTMPAPEAVVKPPETVTLPVVEDEVRLQSAADVLIGVALAATLVSAVDSNFEDIAALVLTGAAATVVSLALDRERPDVERRTD